MPSLSLSVVYLVQCREEDDGLRVVVPEHAPELVLGLQVRVLSHDEFLQFQVQGCHIKMPEKGPNIRIHASVARWL